MSAGRWGVCRLGGLALILWSAGLQPILAQEVAPARLQAVIFVRMFEYDRALKSRVRAIVTFGVVFKAEDKDSTRAAEAMVTALASLESPTVQGLPLRAAMHAYRDLPTLEAWENKEDVSVLYVAPGLSAELPRITALSRERKIVSVSPDRREVEQGLALGLVRNGNRTRMLVNLPVAQGAGMDLDPKLLQLSEVLR